jgi:hypothetical protein
MMMIGNSQVECNARIGVEVTTIGHLDVRIAAA